MSADQRDLREWLPFDAATHDLARRTGQRMGWPELLQLALDGHAPLCVFLPPVEVHAPGAGESHFIVSGSRQSPRTIEGLWDLPAEGLARQHLYELLRDNTGGSGPSMAEIRTGLVVERGTTRWEIPQRVWPDHTTTGRALAVRHTALDALALALTAHPRDLSGRKAVMVTWDQISIMFTSDDRVQVTVGDQSSSSNYEGLGFANRRSPRSYRTAWKTLRALAESNGTLAVPIRQRTTIEKRMQEIRQTLRTHFRREGYEILQTSNPLPYNKHRKSYTSSFTAGVLPSFDT